MSLCITVEPNLKDFVPFLKKGGFQLALRKLITFLIWVKRIGSILMGDLFSVMIEAVF